jgi:riboflavin transporter FmnP
MKNKNTAWLVRVAMLSSVATILMLFEFPLPFIAPPFYEIDLSEVPVFIGAFAMGPLAGVVIEGVKILLNLIVNGTATAGVGEVANFVMGVVFVLPAALIYKRNKTKSIAVLGLITGTVVMTVSSCFINAYVMLPVYAGAFKMPIDVIVGMGTKIWPSVDTMFEFVLICVAPFNLLKGVIVSVITILIYKYVSPLLKK